MNSLLNKQSMDHGLVMKCYLHSSCWIKGRSTENWIHLMNLHFRSVMSKLYKKDKWDSLLLNTFIQVLGTYLILIQIFEDVLYKINALISFKKAGHFIFFLIDMSHWWLTVPDNSSCLIITEGTKCLFWVVWIWIS